MCVCVCGGGGGGGECICLLCVCVWSVCIMYNFVVELLVVAQCRADSFVYSVVVLSTNSTLWG